MACELYVLRSFSAARSKMYIWPASEDMATRVPSGLWAASSPSQYMRPAGCLKVMAALTYLQHIPNLLLPLGSTVLRSPKDAGSAECMEMLPEPPVAAKVSPEG